MPLDILSSKNLKSGPPYVDAGPEVAGLDVYKRQEGTSTLGPFPEIKAVVGGFSIIEVPSREEALIWAARIAKGCRCAQEVREIMFDAES